MPRTSMQKSSKLGSYMFLMLFLWNLCIIHVSSFTTTPRQSIQKHCITIIDAYIPSTGEYKSKAWALEAHMGQQSFSNFKGRTSTCREGAVIPEFEQVSELQRRIDEGIHYEHEERYFDVQEETVFEEVTSVKGIFCGYRGTPEEKSRLKSAHPDDHIL